VAEKAQQLPHWPCCDGGHGTPGAPVDVGQASRERNLGRERQLAGLRHASELADVGGNELLVGQVGELVDAEGVGQVLGILALDEVEVVAENGKALEHLRHAIVLLAEHLGELNEGVLSLQIADCNS